ncbi:MAG TPA: hypothetical protein VNA25_25835 [Phycisphaerae bacterium]|nr:hypothetical protein [Phycisphaerae bacterium]
MINEGSMPQCGPAMQDAFTKMVNETAWAMVKSLVNDAQYGQSDKLRELLLGEVKCLLAKDADVREKLKAAVIGWFEAGCPAPPRRSY